jgi:CxxC motif-containing protein (DUF1111 family)
MRHHRLLLPRSNRAPALPQQGGGRIAKLTSMAMLALLTIVGCRKPPQPGDPLEGLTEEQLATFNRGREMFDSVFTPETGLGPLFNSVACGECHEDPVAGGSGDEVELHASLVRDDGFCDPLADRGGPVYQLSVTEALRDALGIDAEPVPEEADRGFRSSPDVLGFGLLDAVPDSTLLALADPDDADGDGISGRVNRFFDGRIGRFGRKALVPTLAEFNEGAFQIEQGVTNPNVPDEGTVGGEPIPDGVDPLPDPEIDAEFVRNADAFVRFSAPPARAKLRGTARRGEQVFGEVGCAACHVAVLRTGGHEVDALAYKDVYAYTDLLLHDMGPDLADICLGRATRSEFRTEPLMGLSLAERFLHDGRASTIAEAIEAHSGEAAAARTAYGALSQQDRDALLAFLEAL